MQNLPETYWSLVVESGWIQSAIWQIEVEEKKAKVLALSQASHWESDEDLISAADSVLSSAASELADETSEPSKTVFGVAASWVEGGQIKADYIDKIRKLCASLSLEPSGFVVLPEAIAYWVKSNEGGPLSGVVVGIGSENLEISVFKLGNLVGNVSVARSVSLAEDVVEGLVRFRSPDNLPSRILIFDGKEGQLEEARQSLVAIDWLAPEIKEKVNFLHIPKVEIIDPKDKVLAVALAGASEIGQADKVVFVGHIDQSSDPTPELVPEVRSNFDETDVTPEEIGFSSSDIGNVPPPRQILPTIPAVLPKLNLPKFNFHFPRLPRISFAGGPFKGLAIVLALILVVGVVAWFVASKAAVTIYISPKQIDSTQTITLGSDLSQSTQSVSVSGSKTASVTGTKTVGDAAKGSIIIFNGGEVATASAGTRAKAVNGELIFTLDEDVSIPAGSGPSSPSTTNAAVTATDIGAEYNLASGTRFTLEGFSSASVDAKNESAFSGGSSREITAVSAEDRKQVEEKLTSELTEQGITSLKEKLTENDFLIEESVTATAEARTFNHKVGDEASSLGLEMNLAVKGTVVPKQDLAKLGMNYLREKIPSGFVLRADQLEYEFGLTTGKKYKVKFTANLLPEIDTSAIKKKLVGKRPSAAEVIIADIPGFVRTEIKVTPRLGPLATFPFLAKNISIEVAAGK